MFILLVDTTKTTQTKCKRLAVATSTLKDDRVKVCFGDHYVTTRPNNVSMVFECSERRHSFSA